MDPNELNAVEEHDEARPPSSQHAGSFHEETGGQEEGFLSEISVRDSSAERESPANATRRSHWESAGEQPDLSRYDDDGVDLPSIVPNNRKSILSNIPKEYDENQDSEEEDSAHIEDIPANLDEDDTDFEDDTLMDPDNPLMERVQAALLKQLSEKEGKLSIEIKEKEEAVRKALKKREEIGVELYATQQQLARMQALLEGAQDNIAIIKNYREESERALSHTLTQYKEEIQKRSAHAENLEKHRQELDKISITLKQVDLYNDELRSKILVAKRTTLKAEEDIVRQEAEKKRQDYFIDNLSDRLRRLQERRALFETQLLAQQKETKAANDTLHDAATEMEAIQFEKRQLLHQWKSCLIGLQRRDEILMNVEKEIQKNKDLTLTLNGEIAGFRQSLRRTQEQSETLAMMQTKLESEIEHLKRMISNVAEQRDKLMTTHIMHSKMLSRTEEELSQVNQEREAIRLEIAAVLKLTRQTNAGVKKLESDIAENLQNQLSIEKGATGTKRDSNRLRAVVHEKESIIASTMNELGNARLETLNVTEKLRHMRQNAKSLEADLEAKSSLIEKYELEIRRRNDEVGKKQAEMDLLNKKYDMLTSRSQEESMGPLEATIHNVSKLVEGKEADCLQLQQFWMRAQNELVATSKKSNCLQEEMTDLKMRLAVLSRKKAVVNNQFDMELKEIREHQRNIRGLQNDMIKINSLLSKQTQVQSVLEENNIGLEQEFRARLKTAELDSIRIESKIDELRDEKKRALEGLVEAERQLMLWEKKIQLAKETQAALDPNIGATEIREMSIEIHRMKLRYASMLKLQERMIAEMEKSVFRRESIAMRTKTKGKGASQAMLQKEIAELTKKIRITVNDVNDSANDLDTLVNTQERVAQQIQDTQTACKELENRETFLLKNLEKTLTRKQLALGETLLHQRQTRRYSELSQGKYVPLVKDTDMRAAEFIKQQDKLKRIGEVLQSVMNDYPQVKDSINPVFSFLFSIVDFE
ncbi:Coiled-coil domain-containing protein 40 [Entophlyctis luteolus]|nr:Coiled-coil domain-containing protein 40 [Entophlyctis luteolus]KAJ3340035.1 Coiled-coil domain-containing protein 40 [Entophlyctis luteolus]KAJ3378309.1 Coiled-coil domain-containing protein 40 [Entophlyctis sp. JEL0112]